MLEILFQNSFITLRTLNILLVAGFLFTGIFVVRYVNKHKMNLAFATEYFLYVTVSSLIIGRLIYVLTNVTEFQGQWLYAFYLWDLNFNFFGVLAGAILMLFLVSKKKREDFWAWFDVFFLACLALLFFIHIGYFFAGKAYGLPTTLPWGMSFDASHIPFISPIHPTQLYAALVTLLLLTYSVNKSKRTHLSGVVGTRALMIYSLCMLGIDFLHGEPSTHMKIAYGILTALSFITYIHCSHKTHITS